MMFIFEFNVVFESLNIYLDEFFVEKVDEDFVSVFVFEIQKDIEFLWSSRRRW